MSKLKTLAGLLRGGQVGRVARRAGQGLAQWPRKLPHQAGVLPRTARLAAALGREKRRVRAQDPGRPFIGVHLSERLGDLVSCEPVARYLRREHPDAHLVWLVKEQFREIPESFPEVDSVRTVGCLAEGLLLRRTALFDRFVDLHVNRKQCYRCGAININPQGNTAVDVDTYYNYGALLPAACECAGLPRLDDAPRLTLSADVAARVDALGLPDGFVAMHCTSSEANRDWHAEGWRDLARRLLAETGRGVVEVGLAPVIGGDSLRYRSVCGRLSVLETAEVIRRAGAFVGVDSGPAHLANAVGTPGVLLLGPHHLFRRYLPYTGLYADRGGARILFSDAGVKGLTVDEVFQALEGQLAPARR